MSRGKAERAGEQVWNGLLSGCQGDSIIKSISISFCTSLSVETDNGGILRGRGRVMNDKLSGAAPLGGVRARTAWKPRNSMNFISVRD